MPRTRIYGGRQNKRKKLHPTFTHYIYLQLSLPLYHGGGESQLGSTIATISLGSPAMMHFRSKRKSCLNIATLNSRRPTSELKDCLVFPLYHGDIVVMRSGRIQCAYDVSWSKEGICRLKAHKKRAYGGAVGEPLVCPHVQIH
jgi:hypothetical protein